MRILNWIGGELAQNRSVYNCGNTKRSKLIYILTLCRVEQRDNELTSKCDSKQGKKLVVNKPRRSDNARI